MKTYGGFRLNSNCWKILKEFKSRGQDYTKTIEEAVGAYQKENECEE